MFYEYICAKFYIKYIKDQRETTYYCLFHRPEMMTALNRVREVKNDITLNEVDFRDIV
jgi:hypothetical protein